MDPINHRVARAIRTSAGALRGAREHLLEEATSKPCAPHSRGAPETPLSERHPDADADAIWAKRAWIARALAEHERALTTYAARLLGDVERARDVVQETFLRLWEADEATVDDHLAAWLFTVCRHRALDVQKKERRMEPTANPEPSGSAHTPLEIIERRESQGLALRALASLPERQRELVRLKFQVGLSYAEIAAVTGLSSSNVGYLLHVALKAVRSQLGGAS